MFNVGDCVFQKSKPEDERVGMEVVEVKNDGTAKCRWDGETGVLEDTFSVDDLEICPPPSVDVFVG